MLTVDEAIAAVLRRASVLPARSVRLADALGLTLAVDVRADIDLPPFDKALMDGYAVRSADLGDPGEYRLRVVDDITAGRDPGRALGPGESARIMTGAPLPPGADAVVMVEQTRAPGDGTVVVPGGVRPGQNRLPRGREMREGELLLRGGTRIDAAKLGLIASAGLADVPVIPAPCVAVVPTGDELVPVADRPGPGKIRNTNAVMLGGLARALGAGPVFESAIAPDEPSGLRDLLRAALIGPRDAGSGTNPTGLDRGRTDVLLVSGGVSAGTRDLVPSALIDLEIEPVFHKVHVKPGKPLWFGVGPRRGGRPGALVFGLPGNPASGLVGFLLFVRPAIDAMAGRTPARADRVAGRLGVPFAHRGDRPTYHPARLEGGRIIPLDWAGSADLRTVALADGFAAFPGGDHSYLEGDEVPFLPIG